MSVQPYHRGLIYLTVAGTAAGAAGGHPRIISIGTAPGETASSISAVSDDGAAAAGGRYHWQAPGLWHSVGPAAFCWMPALVGLSADGSTGAGAEVTGFTCSRAFRWMPKGGKQDLGLLPGGSQAIAHAISADGLVIVGAADAQQNITRRAFRWTEAGGMQALGESESTAYAVSGDGSVIAGGRCCALPAWRWTAATGMQMLDPLPGSTRGCTAWAISTDGAIIAGTCSAQSGINAPFRWSEAQGTTALPMHPLWQSADVAALSGDGSVAVGTYYTPATAFRAAIWIGGEARDLKEYLVMAGLNTSGWILRNARDINAAGDVIAGNGIFNGQNRGWIAYLSGCYANCTGATEEPLLSVDDFTCFINEFALAQSLPPEQQIGHYANCDHSTETPVLTVDDFTCFINAFAAGCP